MLFKIAHPGPPPVEESRECSHKRLRFVWRIFKGKSQTRRYGFQCLECGDSGRKNHDGRVSSSYSWVSYKNCVEYFDCNPDDAVSMHDSVTRRLDERKSAFYYQKFLDRKNRQTPWWDWYNRYLECNEWKERRRKVLERDGFKCRVAGCGMDADQVHHLTYANVGYEPLDDLVSICLDCHERLHQRAGI